MNIVFDLYKSLNNTVKIKRRAGMYFAHFGLAIFIIGASVSENNKIEKEFTLAIGESIKWGHLIISLMI